MKAKVGGYPVKTSKIKGTPFGSKTLSNEYVFGKDLVKALRAYEKKVTKKKYMFGKDLQKALKAYEKKFTKETDVPVITDIRPKRSLKK